MDDQDFDGVNVGTRVSRWNNFSEQQFHRWSYHQCIFHVLKIVTSLRNLLIEFMRIYWITGTKYMYLYLVGRGGMKW